MRNGSRAWIAAAAGLTLVQIVASALLPRSYALTAVSDIVPTLQMIALLVVFARNARASHGRLRSVWILQALGWSFWLSDQCAWATYDLVLRKPMPLMFLGDVLLFMASVPMLAGVLLRPHLEPSKLSVRLGFVDFLQLMLWWIYIYVFVVMCWQYVAPNADVYNRNFDWLYLVEFLVVAVVVMLLVMQSAGAWRRFYAVFFAAVVLLCASVSATDSAIEAKTYFNGSWYDTPFSAALALFMIMAIAGRSPRPAPETPKDARYSSWMAGLALVAVLSLPVIVVAAVCDRSAPGSIVRFRVIITAATLFLMAALVFVKQRRLHEELRKTNATLEEASLTDPLTGIRNRRYFTLTIESDVAQTLRAIAEGRDKSKRDLVFYLIDLDNFKEVNDFYGHDAGDRVLVEAARRIGTAVRDSDVLLRWGGEEFLIVSRLTDRRQADALALRVLQAVKAEPFRVGPDQELRRTCSIGWSAFPWLEENPSAMDYEEVLSMADRALSQAKKAGKDQAIGMAPFDAVDAPPASTRRESELFLPKALGRAESVDLQLSGRP